MRRLVRTFSVFLFAALWCGWAWAAYCVKCGDKIADDARFCPRCGHKVGAPLDAAEQPKPQAREAPAFKSIEEADKYFTLAENQRNSAGARLLPVLKRKRYQEALDLYLRILQRWPESDKCEVSAYYAALIYESVSYNDWANAIKYYKMVVQINPATLFDARLRVAIVTEEKIEDYDTAIIRYEDCIASARVQSEKEQAAKRLKALREKIEKARAKLETR